MTAVTILWLTFLFAYGRSHYLAMKHRDAACHAWAWYAIGIFFLALIATFVAEGKSS